MYTIKDVAKHAGVSVATVSRVLNQSEHVKEETKQAVNTAIVELQYSPNRLGRNLRRLETKRILVVLSTISNQFYSRVVRGIEDKAREYGYHVLLGTTRDQKEQLEDYYKMLRTKEVDGAIFMTTQMEESSILEALNIDIPIVCACEPIHSEKISYVGIDDRQAAEDAVEYLLESGIDRLALICAGFGDNAIYGSSGLREQGYQSIIKKHGLPEDRQLVFAEGLTYNAGKRAVRRMLELSERPNAIFACSDAGAIGAIRELALSGIRVPEDMQVLGFDNTAMSEVFIPSITTVAQPQYEIGYSAMDLLIKRINGEKTEQKVILEHKIVVRESTRNI